MKRIAAYIRVQVQMVRDGVPVGVVIGANSVQEYTAIRRVRIEKVGNVVIIGVVIRRRKEYSNRSK